MSKNSVLEELRVRRLAVIQDKRDVLKSVLKVRNAKVKVEWVEKRRRAEYHLPKGGGRGKGNRYHKSN